MQTVLEHIQVSKRSGYFALTDDRCDEGGELADWHIAYVRTRNADALTNINFDCMKEAMEEWDVISFNHWAVGWYEMLIVPPKSDSYRKAVELLSRLEDYPILDDSRLSVCEQCETEFDSEDLNTAGVDYRFCSSWCEQDYEREHEPQEEDEDEDEDEGEEGEP